MTAAVRLDLPLVAPMATALASLHAACFARPWSADEIAALAATPGAFAVVAPDLAAPSGFVLGRCARDEAEIVSLGVAPAARRRGLGRALLREAAAIARAAGAVDLYIEVADDNAAARGLYGWAGFQEVGRRPAYYADTGQDAVVMRAALETLAPPDQDPVNV